MVWRNGLPIWIGFFAAALLLTPTSAHGFRYRLRWARTVFPVVCRSDGVVGGNHRRAPGLNGGPSGGALIAILVLVACAAVGLVVALAGSLWDRIRRKRRSTNSDTASASSLSWRVVVGVGLAVVLLPVATDVSLEARTLRRIRACPAMQTGGPASMGRDVQSQLAAACDLQSEAEPAETRRVETMRIDIYRASGDTSTATDDVADISASVLAYHGALLGDSRPKVFAVLPIRLSDLIRGKAGPGFVLVEAAELRAPSECDEFRGSAGVDGRCGAWVVAYELAHQWFRWTAYQEPGIGYAALVEGTADYMTFDWWRSEYGDADARRLAGELFGGRMALAPGFAASRVPAAAPDNMTDRQIRALVMGRAFDSMACRRGRSRCRGCAPCPQGRLRRRPQEIHRERRCPSSRRSSRSTRRRLPFSSSGGLTQHSHPGSLPARCECVGGPTSNAGSN